MACRCKKHIQGAAGATGDIDVPADYNKPPDEACAVCADKHFSAAWQLAKETGYEHQNRRAVVGELVLLGWHLAEIAPEFCQKVREIRHRWQVFNFQAAAPLWEPLGKELDGILLRELEKEVTPPAVETDVVIPLNTSASAALNEELRFALRSIEKYAKGIRHVWIAGAALPGWVQNVRFVKTGQTNGKQNSIHRAVAAVMREPECAERVIFWADDNVLLSPLEAGEFPVVTTGGSLLDAPANDVWWNRTRRETGELLQAHSFPTVSWEAHAPVVFERKKYLQMDREFNFAGSDAGLCYISVYLNRYRAAATALQQNVKATVTREFSPAELAGKTFLGYNDGGVRAGILGHLAERFPEPSKYEKVCDHEVKYPSSPQIGAVLGTFGRPDLVELQLHWLCRINGLPVLVHDDASPEAEAVRAVCSTFAAEGFDVEFTSTEHGFGHRRGDVMAFAAGLEWAEKRGFDLLYKVSRRFVIRHEWAGMARELAARTGGITFSNFTTAENLGFRTEFCGMKVREWAPMVPRLRQLAAEPIRQLVEAEIHNMAKELAAAAPDELRWRMIEQGLERDRQGYILIPWMGNDRSDPPPGVLWHHKHTEEDYQEALKEVRR